MKKKRVIGITLLSLLMAATILVIWALSTQSPSDSQKTSSRLSDWLYSLGFYHLFEYATFYHLVRKVAHVTEYTILAIETTSLAFLVLAPKERKWRRLFAFSPILSGVLVASVDEVIQHFNGRHAALTDVMIDTLGTLIGFIFVFLVRWLAGRASIKNVNC